MADFFGARWDPRVPSYNVISPIRRRKSPTTTHIYPDSNGTSGCSILFEMRAHHGGHARVRPGLLRAEVNTPIRSHWA